jgi:redox-sensitive bicupin YhaK (pirin superfamily)
MTVTILIKGHEKDLGGGFVVRRYLPAAVKQAVGPFIFFDHFGPVDVPADANHDVRPHPHIGLATVTYLFEGAMDHRDSVGSVQRIEPGAINWMTAGRGIVHSDVRRPIWSGVPHRTGCSCGRRCRRRMKKPNRAFATRLHAIPEYTAAGVCVRVLVGSAFGQTSPVQTYSQTLYLDVMLQAGAELALEQLPAEAAIYPISGEISVDGAGAGPACHGLLDTAAALKVSAHSEARFVLIGGEPLDGHRYMSWNFVSSRKERIVQASAGLGSAALRCRAGRNGIHPATGAAAALSVSAASGRGQCTGCHRFIQIGGMGADDPVFRIRIAGEAAGAGDAAQLIERRGGRQRGFLAGHLIQMPEAAVAVQQYGQRGSLRCGRIGFERIAGMGFRHQQVVAFGAGAVVHAGAGSRHAA